MENIVTTIMANIPTALTVFFMVVVIFALGPKAFWAALNLILCILITIYYSLQFILFLILKVTGVIKRADEEFEREETIKRNFC